MVKKLNSYTEIAHTDVRHTSRHGKDSAFMGDSRFVLLFCLLDQVTCLAGSRAFLSIWPAS
jgi:hypothetical protein